MIGVLVVSPSPTVRAGLRAFLTAGDGIEVVWEAGGAGELAPPWPAQPDVALVDCGDEQGGAAVAALAAIAPSLGIVLLGGEPARRAAPDLAPRGYLSRDAGPEEIAAAVRAVASGLTAIEPALLPALAGAGALVRAEPNADAEEPLTPRELEVLQLLAAGLPNKTIARRLGISEHTAKFHVSAVLAKLDAASRTEAVATAARRGLVLL
ncbi:MAG TPA: response regulator transcription factor [Thermomicrobiales bacterium]|nr:response regulator transcription factor [Thermomicrobiales bacterium]